MQPSVGSLLGTSNTSLMGTDWSVTLPNIPDFGGTYHSDLSYAAPFQLYPTYCSRTMCVRKDLSGTISVEVHLLRHVAAVLHVVAGYSTVAECLACAGLCTAILQLSHGRGTLLGRQTGLLRFVPRLVYRPSWFLVACLAAPEMEVASWQSGVVLVSR
jgi:hypothetical protein